MKIKYTKLFWMSASITLLACTKQPSDPIVTELEITPSSYTYTTTLANKPFKVSAKYSDNAVKNITANVNWVSENSALIEVTPNGELQKKKSCELPVCIVSLIATHRESGKSQRVEVKLLPDKNQQTPDKKSDQKMIDDSVVDKATKSETQPIEHNEANASAVDSIAVGDVVNKVDSGTPTTHSESSATEPQNAIISIGFANPELQIYSGQTIRPSVVSVGENGGPLLAEGAYTCVIESAEQDTLVIESGCDLKAMAPGKASVRLQAASVGYQSDSVLSVDVVPIELFNDQLAGFKLTLAESQKQTWIRVNGIIPGQLLRYSAKGALPPGFQLFTLASLDSNEGACVNTVPAEMLDVSCIIKPLYNEIYLMFHKPIDGAVNVSTHVEILPSELLSYSLQNNSMTPQDLVKNNLVKAYILANEFGIYNRHFYQYNPEPADDGGLRVLLSGFDAAPSLEVFWSNGYCTDDKLKTGQGGIWCEIPSGNVGTLWIAVNANKAGGMFNGPVAQKGGTYYTLQVTN